jgi:hypothetical protein
MTGVGKVGKNISYTKLQKEVVKMVQKEMQSLKGKPLSKNEKKESAKLADLLSSGKTLKELHII